MIRTAVYIRVSNKSQVEGFSLDAQQRTCTDYAAAHGLEIVGFYVEEGVTGRHTRRPAFQRLLAEIKPKSIRSVLIYDLDRFMRNLRLQLNLKAELDALGVSLISLNDAIDTSTPEGVLQFQLKGMLAEWFSNQLGRKTKMGILEKVQQGYWHGPVPVGYEVGPAGILIHSADAPGVHMAFRLYATAQYSYETLGEQLTRDGYTIPNVQTRQRSFYTKWNVRELLQNPVYLGKVRLHGQLYPGLHQPLVDQKTWDIVQDLRVKYKPKHGRQSIPATSPEALLIGIAACATCGAPAWHHSGGYYVCKDRYATPKCKSAGVRGWAVEAHILKFCDLLTLPNIWKSEIIERAQNMLVQHRSTVDPAALVERLKRCKNLYLNGDMTESEYVKEKEKIQLQLAESPATPVPDLHAAAAQLVQMRDVFMIATRAEQRALLSLLFKQVWVEAHRVVAVTPTQTYLALVTAARAAMLQVVSNSEPGGQPAHYLTVPETWRTYRIAA